MNFDRVLITGTTSGMGQAFQKILVEQGKEVLAVNRRKSGSAQEAVIDITQYEEVLALLSRLQQQKQIPDLFCSMLGSTNPIIKARWMSEPLKKSGKPIIRGF